MKLIDEKKFLADFSSRLTFSKAYIKILLENHLKDLPKKKEYVVTTEPPKYMEGVNAGYNHCLADCEDK